MKTLKEIQAGCGKEINHNIFNEITICRREPKGVFIENAQPLTKAGIQNIVHSPSYKFELCPTCQALETQTKGFLEMINRMLDSNDRFAKTGTIYPKGIHIPFINGEELKKEVEG